jgi:hypothetical protein
MSKFIDKKGHKAQYFVCNYAAIATTDRPLLFEGAPASNCKNGESSDHPGLCSPDEHIDPNNYDWTPNTCEGKKSSAEHHSEKHVQVKETDSDEEWQMF